MNETTASVAKQTGKDLFTHLLLRLHNFNDAAVLWIFLKNQCDEAERATTSGEMSFDELGETITIKAVQRSIGKLAMAGYITVRPHKNTRTLVTVNREAVLELLRQPLINAFRLPGLSQKEFPFLDVWNADPQAMDAVKTEIIF